MSQDGTETREDVERKPGAPAASDGSRQLGHGPVLWVVAGVIFFCVVGSIAAAGVAVVLLRDSVSLPDVPSRVPGVVERPGDEAERVLRSEGFEVEREPVGGPVAQEGRVARQDPAAGSFRREGATITLGIVTLEEVPDLTSTDREAAEDGLSERLQIETGGVEVAGEPAGTILSQSPQAGVTVPWNTTVSVVVSAGQPANPGDIFEEDFSEDRASGNPGGWITGEDDSGSAARYTDGRFRLSNAAESEYVIQSMTQTAGSVDDAVIEVDATRVGDMPGEDNVSSWGIACRTATDTVGGYLALIYDSGYAQIVKYSADGQRSVLAEGYRRDAIREGLETNHLQMDCVEDDLALYANGRRLLKATDPEFAQGSTGLFVSYGSDTKPGIAVDFDDFRVSTPE